MFVDFITLLLANMVGGLWMLAMYFIVSTPGGDHRHWAPAFLVPGLVAFLAGLYMALTWPVTQFGEHNLRFANMAFGECSVLLGVLFLGGALALAKNWTLAPLGPYAFVAGALAVLLGIRFHGLGLTNSPNLTSIGYVLTGTAGLLAPAALGNCCGRVSRIAAALLLLAAGGIWAYVAGLGYWGHMANFSK